jgi:O-antigen/teichoic acid export membrane protein
VLEFATEYMRTLGAKAFAGEIVSLLNLRAVGKRGFVGNALVVMSGTGVAQLISFLLSPLLSRLYGRADFGLFGCFSAVSGVISAGITLQYAQAIILPKKDDVAAKLFIASCITALTLTAATSLLFVLIPASWLAILKAPELKPWLWLVPLAALVAGLNQTLTFWCVRLKAFKHTAVAQVITSSTKGLAQMGAGILGFGGPGLIGGLLAGDILGNFALCRWVFSSSGSLLRKEMTTSAIRSAVEYKDFPIYCAPQNILNALSQGAPILLLTHYYGISVGGLYAFTARILDVPMRFVLTALRQVLFQKFTELNHDGANLPRVFLKTTAGLFAIAIVPAAIGFAVAPHLFVFVFGSEWYAAGEYSRWLLLWLVPAFCNLPASLFLRILRHQRALLLFDVGILTARIIVLVLGGRYLQSSVPTIAAFSAAGGLFEIWLLWYGWSKLPKPDSARLPRTELNSVACSRV